MKYKAWQIGACLVSVGLSHRFDIKVTVKCSAVVANSTCALRLWSTKVIHLGERKIVRWNCEGGKPTVWPRGLIPIFHNQSQNVEMVVLKLVCLRGWVPDIVFDKRYDCAVRAAVMCMYVCMSAWTCRLHQYIGSKSVSNNFCQSSPIFTVIFTASLHLGLTSHLLKRPRFLQFVLHYLPPGKREFKFFWSRQSGFKFYYPEMGHFWHPVQWGWQLCLNLRLMQSISSWTVRR